MLSKWDGTSAEVSKGGVVYRVRQYAPMGGKQHAYELTEGMYFVRAAAKGYDPLNWTAVSVRYEDGVMEMKLSLTAASAATSMTPAGSILTKAAERDSLWRFFMTHDLLCRAQPRRKKLPQKWTLLSWRTAINWPSPRPVWG